MSIWTDQAGRIHVGIMVSGKRVHRRLPEGASARDAKLIEAELRRSVGRKQTHIPGDPLLTAIMALYIDHTKTLRSPETAQFHALRTGPWCEGKRASDAEAVAAKMIRDMRESYAPATINRSLGAIKTALKIAYQAHIIPENYGDRIKRLPENNKRNTYLTLAEVKQLADQASEQVRAAIWIALLTGCRRGEILKLEKTDILENSLRIRAGNTKKLKERLCPIVPALRPWLEYVPLQINFEGLKTGFRRAREKAGIEANFHDLRHSCASMLINIGVSLDVIRDILGHASVKTTERYAHLQIHRQTQAMNQLSDLVESEKITPEITPGRGKKKAACLKAA